MQYLTGTQRKAVKRAAELLESEAEAMRNCATIYADDRTDWGDELDAKAAYEEFITVGTALRAML